MVDKSSTLLSEQESLSEERDSTAAGPSSVPVAAGGREGRTGLAEVTAGPGSAPTESPPAQG